MKTLGICFVSALLIGSSMSSASAAENESAPASFSLQFSGLKWAQSTTKYSDESSKRELTTLMTADLVDSMIWTSIGKVNLYFYPFLDSNALVSLSYMVRDDLELGIDLGLNARKMKNPKSELSTDQFGGFVTWLVPIGNCTLENLVNLNFFRMEDTTIDSTTNEEASLKINGTLLKLSSNIVVPIAKNAWYLAGVWWNSENGKNQTMDVTSKSTQFGLTLAGLRLTID